MYYDYYQCLYNYTNIRMQGVTFDTRGIFIENEYGDLSSNSSKICLCFTLAKG